MMIKKLLVLCVAMATFTVTQATERFVKFTPVEGALPLSNASISYSADEYEGVKIAINNLKIDIEKVLGKTPNLLEGAGKGNILIGTLGKNKDIDKLKLANLKGKREKYIITTVGNQLVIAGSDRRGTIYGIYELSQQLGVSPWYYWADVPITKRDEAYIIKGTYTDGEPAVEFRGIFLNDEAPCLTSWVKNTFGTDYGDHHFYEKVFELILRLKGNMMWPAMWGWAFYADDPENGKLADRMGVMMGTSHHEPMARNHQEYARNRGKWGAWNYQTNQEKLDQFFREGIERIKGTEDIVTIGMRGDGDEAMSDKADTKLMERIINNQRQIIKEVTGRPAEKTTQVWALYKEVQDYYDAGLRVPDDVMILISDDNWGDIRRVPNANERKRKGGWGIYYHVDYVGAPRNTKWLNVTQTQQMFEQLSLAYDWGIQRMWILNVGDLKPMEYPIQLFMDMAWNPKEYNLQNVTNHTTKFFRRTLGCEVAKEAADIYNQNCQFMARVTPEMLDARTYNVETGEWKQVADEYQRLEARALRLFAEIPQESQDAYRQLILFPVQAMANLYDMYYAQAMNQYLAKRNSPDANMWAKHVEKCFKRDSLLCAYYNKEMSQGKWDGMMTQKHIGYRSWNDNFRRDMLPQTTTVADSTAGGYTFTPSNGYVSMEAEHYYSATAPQGMQWTVYPYYGRTRSAVALTPNTCISTGNSTLTYRFSLPADAPKTVKVHVIVKSTLDFLNIGGFCYNVSLDSSEPQKVNFNEKLVDRQPYMYSDFYPTIARRVVEKVMELPVGNAGVHELKIQPKHPGIVFEKIVVDFGGYRPSYLYMTESDYKKE